VPKIAVVTGASSGIGLASAVALAHAGFTVVAAARDPGRISAALAALPTPRPVLHLQRLDVTQDDSVSACVAAVLQAHGRLDLLLNNAGCGFVGTLESTPHREALRVMDVNFHGVWRMTQAVLPSMRQAGAGRVLTLSSIGGVLGQPFNDAYCAAKFAVEGLMESLAPVTRRFGVHMSLIEPGAVATEFVNNADTQTGTRDLPEVYATQLKSYLQASQKVFAQAQSAQDVAKVIVEAATAVQPLFRYQTSAAMRQMAGVKLADVSGEAGIALTMSRLG
jgi:NAD(P)-dependent dehydrogenase (short-subunit alcohol dehydrogenase family)